MAGSGRLWNAQVDYGRKWSREVVDYGMYRLIITGSDIMECTV